MAVTVDRDRRSQGEPSGYRPRIARLRARAGAPLAALAAAAAVTGVALPLGATVPLIGAPLFALAIGVGTSVVAPARALDGALRALPATSALVLKIAIVVLGATIALGQVLRVGGQSLPVMLGSLAAALLIAAVAGRALGVAPRLRTLVGVGTGICGASAIAAVSGVVRARERETTLAISTIFAFNLVAVVAFPPLGHLLGMSQHDFGVWAGTAVNDTSSVVAAGQAYGDAANATAIVVKLTRTTMIVPVALALVAIMQLRRRGPGGVATPVHWARIVPWFLLGFLATATANSLGLVGDRLGDALGHAGLILTTIALAGIGLATDLPAMRRAGIRPLALGLAVWAGVAISSLAMARVT